MEFREYIGTDKDEYVKGLWMQFGGIPINPQEEIEEEWNAFPAGTRREDILDWFEETFNVSVVEDLMGLLEYEQQKISDQRKVWHIKCNEDIVAKNLTYNEAHLLYYELKKTEEKCYLFATSEIK